MHVIVRHTGHRLRRHVRRVWASRGGGFYGFVATLTFVYLEAQNLWGDVAAVRGIQISTSGILGGVVGWFVQNLVQGIMAAVWASIWPVEWMKRFGVGLTSGALLVGAYFLFLMIRPAVLRLLHDPDDPESSEVLLRAAQRRR